jgi:RNA polymerase sigma factor (sigma-70 family)
MKENPKTIKYRHAIPTQDDMRLLDIAVGSHMKNMSKKGMGWVDRGEFIGDAFEGMLKAIDDFDPARSDNREGFIIQKIKFHLIDVFRADKKLRSKHVIKLTSLDYQLNDDGDTVAALVENKLPDPTDIACAGDMAAYVENIFLQIPVHKKNDWSGSDLFQILMLRMEGFTFDAIADLCGVTQGTIHRLFKVIIDPKLEEIREILLDEPECSLIELTA